MTMSKRKQLFAILTIVFISYAIISMTYTIVSYNHIPGIQEGELTDDQFGYVFVSAIVSMLIGKILYYKYDDIY